MPIDPEIALKGPYGPEGYQPPSPFTTMSNFANLQSAINQNRLFSQTFAARQMAGQILAAAPTLEEGANALFQNPLTAAFAPEIVNSIRQMELSTAQLHGAIQEQSLNGFQAWLKSLTPAMSDPSQLESRIQANLSLLGPEAREHVEPAMAALVTGLTSGLDKVTDPGQRSALFRQRLAGTLLGAGVTPDLINGQFGTPITQDVGGRIITGTQAPAYAGGAITPAQSITKGIAPSIQNVPSATGASIPSVVSTPGGDIQPAGGGGVPPASGTPAPPNALAPPPPSPAPGPNALAPPGGPSVGPGPMGPGVSVQPLASPVTTPSSQETDIAGDLGKDFAQRLEKLPTTARQVDTMIDALSRFQAGGGAILRGEAGQALQALKNIGFTGITNDMVNKVANGDLGATQTFTALIRQQAVTMLKEAATGTGRVMLPEVQAFMSMLNAAKDPNAVLTILNNLKYAMQVGYDQAANFPKFKDALKAGDPSTQGYTVGDYMQWYMKQGGSPLPTTTPSGINLGPVPRGKILGTGMPGATVYKTPQDVGKAYKSGAIGRAQAQQILRDQFNIQ